METKHEKCIICGDMATRTVKKQPYCKHHYNQLVVTKPIVKTMAIQFRNELCACGSGKKFKNCCSSKLTDQKPLKDEKA